VFLSHSRIVSTSILSDVRVSSVRRSREKLKYNFQTMSAELAQLRLDVVELKQFVKELRPLLSTRDQVRLRERFVHFQ